MGLECGACTACCYTHGVDELGKPAFTPCVHLGFVPELGREGCTVYENRPASCRKMACSWLQGKLGKSEEMRPDQFGLVTSGHVDEGIGPTAHIVEAWPGAVDNQPALGWFCQQTHAAERGDIQPVVLERVVGKLVYGTPELIRRLNGEASNPDVNGRDDSADRVRERFLAGVSAGQATATATDTANE